MRQDCRGYAPTVGGKKGGRGCSLKEDEKKDGGLRGVDRLLVRAEEDRWRGVTQTSGMAE